MAHSVNDIGKLPSHFLAYRPFAHFRMQQDGEDGLEIPIQYPHPFTKIYFKERNPLWMKSMK